MQKLTASIFILIASISYGSLGIIAKFAYADGVDPKMLALFQMGFGLLFFLLLKPKKIIGFLDISKKSIFFLSIGGFMSALTAYFYYRSLGSLSASIAIIMLFQFVWIGLALELIYKKRLPTTVEMASILLCYAGTFLSVGMDGQSSEAQFSGLIFGFISGAAFAVYIFFSSTLCLQEESDTRTFWIILSAFLGILVLTCMELSFEHLMATIKWGAVCGFLGVLVPFYIYAVFSPRIGAAATSLIGSAELPSALALSVLLLGERLSGFQIIGSLLVVFAVFAVFMVEAKAK